MARSFALLLVLLLAGCAGGGDAPQTAGDTYQEINVTTPGQTGAYCFLQAGPRSYTTSTPGTLRVLRAADAIDVTCFKGEHMVGSSKVAPTMAMREADRIAGQAGASCISCRYPAIISVAMGLDQKSLQRSVKHIR